MWCEVWVKGRDQSLGQRSRSKLIICLWRLKQSHTVLWESCCLPADCLYAFVSADRGASALLFWLLLLYSKSWSSNGDPLILLCFFPSQVVLAIQIICISMWILELSGECILLGSVSSQQRFGAMIWSLFLKSLLISAMIKCTQILRDQKEGATHFI